MFILVGSFTAEAPVRRLNRPRRKRSKAYTNATDPLSRLAIINNRQKDLVRPWGAEGAARAGRTDDDMGIFIGLNIIELGNFIYLYDCYILE